MGQRKKSVISTSRNTRKKGRGFLNTLINKLPVELHVPGYNYCGPGTKLEKRLQRGDIGVNPLDEACKRHDIDYSKSEDIEARNIADKKLARFASERLKSSDAKLGEKVTAFGVSNIMNLKSKLGMGLRRKKKYPKKQKKGGELKVARKRKNKQKKRVIPIPKKGGFLPLLLPLLGALGAVGGGAASIASAINKAKTEKQRLTEQKRHDLAMEQKGKGLYLKPRKGYGMFAQPYQKNC